MDSDTILGTLLVILCVAAFIAFGYLIWNATIVDSIEYKYDTHCISQGYAGATVVWESKITHKVGSVFCEDLKLIEMEVP